MVFEKVQQFVSKQLDIDPEKVTMESSLVDDLKADSLDIIELIMDMEQEFNIQIEDDELENIRTIGDVVARLEALAK